MPPAGLVPGVYLLLRLQSQCDQRTRDERHLRCDSRPFVRLPARRIGRLGLRPSRVRWLHSVRSLCSTGPREPRSGSPLSREVGRPGYFAGTFIRCCTHSSHCVSGLRTAGSWARATRHRRRERCFDASKLCVLPAALAPLTRCLERFGGSREQSTAHTSRRATYPPSPRCLSSAAGWAQQCTVRCRPFGSVVVSHRRLALRSMPCTPCSAHEGFMSIGFSFRRW